MKKLLSCIGRTKLFLLSIFLLLLTHTVSRLSAAQTLGEKFAQVTTAGSHLRTAPSPKAKIVAQAKPGNVFKLSAATAHWYKIILPNGQKCYLPKSVSKIITAEEFQAIHAKNKQKISSAATLEPASEKTAVNSSQEQNRVKEADWLKDKYVLIKNSTVNLRSVPTKKSQILAKAHPGDFFKLLSRAQDWYEVFLPPDQNAYLNAKLGKIIPEADLPQPEKIPPRKIITPEPVTPKVGRFKSVLILADHVLLKSKASHSSQTIGRAGRGDKFTLVWKLKNWYEVQISSGTTAFVSTVSSKIIEPEMEKLSEQTTQEFQVPADTQTKNTAEQKILEDKNEEEAEQKAREQKLRLEAEAKAKEVEWLKDKYILVTTKNTNLRKAASKNTEVIGKAKLDESYKLASRTRDWYEVQISSGTTAFLFASLAKLITEPELSVYRQQQEQARIEAEQKAKALAEEKAQQQEELKAKLEAETKAREEAEHKAKEAAALKAKLKAEAAAQEQEWLKDKYVLVTTKNTNLRKAANKNSAILSKSNSGDIYKLLSRHPQGWHEIFLPSDQNAFVSAKLVNIVTEVEVQTRIEAERKTKEEKERLIAEAKAKREAEEKERQQILQAKLEAARKAREEAEHKAKDAAELKAKREAELKAQEQEWLKDKYVLITLNKIKLREKPRSNARVVRQPKVNEAFKLVSRSIKDWYEVTFSAGSGFVEAKTTKILNEEEIKDLKAAEVKAKEEASLKAKLAAEEAARIAAEEKAHKEAEALAKLQAEQKNREETERKTRQEAEAKLKRNAEIKAKQEIELKAKLAAEQKARQEAEQKAAELAELKAKHEADAKAKMEEYVKDKYVQVTSKEANLRSLPNLKANIKSKAKANDIYKLDWVENGKWYRITISSSTPSQVAFIYKDIARIVSEQDLQITREKERLAQIESELIIKEEKARQERIAAEEKVKKENQLIAKLESDRRAQAELKAKEEAEQKAREEAERKAKLEEEREDKAEYIYVSINAPYAEIKAIPDFNASALYIALKGDTFKYNGQQKGWYHILTFSGETRFVRKSLCRGTNTGPSLPKSENIRRDIYDSIIDAKDKALADGNQKYSKIKTQQELQEKIYYQQIIEEKYLTEVFHRFKIQPANYLSLLTEAISKEW